MKLKNKRFIEKIINILLNILIFIFGILLLLSIYTGVQTKILGHDYANFFGYSMFEVQTGSMAKTINAGDWIIVKLGSEVALNDIVTYQFKDEFITHRIIEVHKGTYITKGDANNSRDEPITQKQIVGKVISILANFGLLRKIIFNPAVLISLMITLFFFNMAIKKNKQSKIVIADIKESVLSFADGVLKKAKLLFNKIMKRRKPQVEKVPIIEKTNDPDDFEKDKYVDDDELEKTALFRAIPVDLTEIDKTFMDIAKNKMKQQHKYAFLTNILSKIKAFIKLLLKKFGIQVEKQDNKMPEEVVTSINETESNNIEVNENDVVSEIDEGELNENIEPELEGVISVDLTEVDDTFLEIAKNEMKISETNEKNKEKAIASELKQEDDKDKAEIDETDENLTNISLELLKNKKGKNVIDTAMIIKKEELNEMLSILIKDDKKSSKKTTIKDMFVTSYIDAKYYNYFSDMDIDYHGKNSTLKIEKAIKEVALASELLYTYNSNEGEDNAINIYTNAFLLIANLEQAKDSITDLKAKKEFYKKEITKYFKELDNVSIKNIIEEAIKIQKKYSDILECFLKKLETNIFNLNFNKLSTNKDMYGLQLEHNVTFSKVYSDYIIDKTYTEGIIAEDKMEVLLTLLSIQLIKDMLLSNFDRKYILYIPNSLYTKEKKFDKLLSIIDDKYAKDNVIILLKLNELLDHKRIIKKVRKMGYKFALVLDERSVIEDKDRNELYVADYIFINKKTVNMEKKIASIPKDLVNNVIAEDIIGKIGDFGSE